MAIKLATTNDLDLAPFFFPLQVGWAMAPNDMLELVPGTVDEAVERLLSGEVDVALIDPALYALHQTALRILPLPMHAADIYSDNLFLISKKRLDQYEKPRVKVAKNNKVGEMLLRILAKPYYGFEPEIQEVANDVDALNALTNPDTDICIARWEVGMRAAGPAKNKNYFVEDLSKAWWFLSGVPVPTGVFAVRAKWIEQEGNNANTAIKKLMIFLRSALLKAKEQMETMVELEETRTGIPAEGLLKHYAAQRYEPNSAHISGLLEMYRRASSLHALPAVADIGFFPSLEPLAPAPKGPPRRVQPEASSNDKRGNARERAQAQGLKVLEGGKNNNKKRKDGGKDEENEDEGEE
jgi:predicted solute-binding protein